MKAFRKHVIISLLLGALLAGLTGCTSIVEEDPNEAQIPWATPADWEGTVPGMPNRGGY